MNIKCFGAMRMSGVFVECTYVMDLYRNTKNGNENCMN